MSIRVMSWVWDNGPEDRDELLVLLALADFADDNGACYPSMAGIAEKARLTERGARGIVRRLETNGWITTKVGGGRGGKSYYRLHRKERAAAQNPEPETRNEKPGIPNPESQDRKPGTARPETRNQRSAEPSGTVKEPSEARAVRAALCSVLPPEVAEDWIAHRKAKRSVMTAKAAELIAAKLRTLPDPVGAVHHAIAQGWTGIYPPQGGQARASPAADLDAKRARWKRMAADYEDDTVTPLRKPA